MWRAQPDARRVGIIEIGRLPEPETLLAGLRSQQAAADICDAANSPVPTTPSNSGSSFSSSP